MESPFDKTFLQRSWQSTRLAGKLGFQGLKNKLRGQDALQAFEEREEELLNILEEIVSQADEMKGLIMKLGQIASFMSTHLPPKATQILAKLQTAATPMPYELVKNTIESELGEPITDLFDDFTPSAFAAASIGQVHKATSGSHTVAVKVQYPGIEAAITKDLKLMKVAMKVLAKLANLPGAAYEKELTERFLLECDYFNEAKNQRLFRDLLSNRADIHVPYVLPKLSSKRVYTSEYITGQSYYTMLKESDQTLKNAFGKTLFEVTMSSIFIYGVFHADPHPGNYLFSPSGHLTLLDFGCIKCFTPDVIILWRNMINSVRNENRTAFIENQTALGFTKTPEKMDWDAQWALFNLIYSPFKTSRVFQYNENYVKDVNRAFLRDNKNFWHGSLPPDLLLATRLQFGLAMILAQLQAENNYGEIIDEIFSMPIQCIN